MTSLELYSSCKAFFIGINNYKKLFNLHGAENDVHEMHKLFELIGFEVNPPLLNEKATKINIDRLFDNLRNNLEGTNAQEKAINKESLIIIYFAGHGTKKKIFF